MTSVTVSRDDTEWLRLVGEIRESTGWDLPECEQAADTIIRDIQEGTS